MEENESTLRVARGSELVARDHMISPSTYVHGHTPYIQLVTTEYRVQSTHVWYIKHPSSVHRVSLYGPIAYIPLRVIPSIQSMYVCMYYWG